MLKTTSYRSLWLALFLVNAIVFQSLAIPGRGVVFAKAADPEMKKAPGALSSELAALFEVQKAAGAQTQNPSVPNAPTAAVIVATLTDNITAATKVAPGGTINYTATITNNGAASPADDATNLNFSAPLDANTTLVASSIHASPIARNDTYNWVGNTFLDTSARALPSVTANDVVVNAPAGTDTITVTPNVGGATALGGVVSMAASGHYTYTPPLNRPNIGDGASVNDSFTYTITNSADPALTSTGTVTISLTGRVFYLQAGAAGDGRSGTPSGNPATMSTNADKSTDIFYIFSNAGSLSGLFTVDAGQQLLGQGVALVINIPVLGSTTLFTAAAPTPTTTNSAGNCVTLGGAPGNNTLSGFNIGNCTGGTAAIAGSNVGTLNVSTVSINTNVGALDLTGVSTPTVSVLLGGTTSTGGAKNVNLVGLNGTITLNGGALSGAAGNGLDINGGTAAITYTGTINNSGGKQVNVANKTGGSVALSGAVGGAGIGINLTTNTGATISFTGGVAISSGTNAAFTATGGGIVSATQNNTSIVNTLTTTTGTALNVANTTIGASGLTFRSISAGTGAGSAGNGIILDTTGATGGLTVTGNGGTCTFATPTCDGGTIQHKTGADSVSTYTSGLGIYLNSTSNVSLTRMHLHDFDNGGIRGRGTVNGFTLQNSVVDGANGTCNSAACDVEINNGEDSIRFTNLTGSALIDGCFIGGGFADNVRVINNSGTLNRLTISNSNIGDLDGAGGQRGLATNAQGGQDDLNFESKDGITAMNVTVSNNTLNYGVGDIIQASNNDNTAPIGTMDVIIRGNTVINSNASDQVNGASGITVAGLGTTTYDVSCNKVANSKGIDVNLFKGHEPLATGIAANFTGTVYNNTIGLTGVSHSGGGAGASALAVDMQGRGTHTVLIKNNVIRQYGEAGIRLNNVDNNSTAATLNATVIGNTTIGVDADAFTGIFVVAGAAAGTDSSNITNLKLGGAGAEQNNFTAGDPANGADVFLQHGVPASTFNLSKANSASNTPSQIVIDNNVSAGLTVFTDAGINAVLSNPTLPPAINEACSPPPIPNPVDDTVRNQVVEESDAYAIARAEVELTWEAGTLRAVSPVDASVAPASTSYRATLGNIMYHARSTMAGIPNKLDSIITPTAYAQESAPNAPTSGEVVSLNTIATFPAGGKSITIKYSATVNAPPLARQVSTQGTVTANAGAISVLTDDPEPAGGPQATVTVVDTAMTWNGSTSTDWNTVTNWTQPAGGTQYAPGVSNPAINDVVIPNVGAQPNISATDIGVFSLSIANGRTLTITNPRVLTIGGSPGGDLTLDGIITGGNLNLGTGTHVINNAGGTGSLSSTNVATVLSGSTVTLNNNLQAGALAVNAGGSMNITNRTLSLNGSGAALAVPGGATFTTTGSTVIFNGTAAQQAAGIAYNNLTINNTIGAHVTGVTLTGNASVAAALTLTSSDLATTGAFTLTMPAAATSGPASGATDVVGNVKRTGFVSGGAALSFGNPLNTIRINSGAAPADINMLIAKNPPATYAAAVSRSYIIMPNGANGPATLRLHYRQTELNGNSEAPAVNFNLRRGPNWGPAVVPTARNIGVAEDNWLENNAVASFSEWTFASLAPTAVGGAVIGRIVDSNGRAVEGAVVRLSGAQNRKFITDANGNYRFENVETGGFYTVTPSRANYNFNPFNRSFSQTGNETQAVFTATSMGDNENPLDTAEYFVRQQYVDVLRREPDESGFNYWSDQLLACGDDASCTRAQRTGVAAAFFIENEAQQTGSYIYDVYAGPLGRRPAFGEYSADRGQVVGGGTLDTAKTVFAQNFVQRAEFVTKYAGATTAAAFVDALIESAQSSDGNISIERSNLISLYGQTSDQVTSRAAVVRSLADNATFKKSQYNQAFVLTEYFSYLQREIDLNGYTFWVGVLNTGDPGNYRGMVCSFTTSAEYQNRFSTVVSHNNGECGQ